MAAVETFLVGTDGSRHAQAAVRWAAVEADRRGAALHVLHAYDEARGTVPGRPAFGVLEGARNQAEAIVADVRLAVTATAPTVTVQAHAVIGDAATVLVEAASSADLVVVGSRGRGGITSLVLGSTSQHVAAHAPCPTAIVRGRTMALQGPVVVGADASPSGSPALRAAFEEADVRHASLLVVRAYRMPTMAYTPGMPPLVVTATEQEAAEQSALADLLAPWREKFPAVPVETSVSRGSAARILIDASCTAQLVVVGDRGWGDLLGTVLGSVTSHLVHHANCPVLIAR